MDIPLPRDACYKLHTQEEKDYGTRTAGATYKVSSFKKGKGQRLQNRKRDWRRYWPRLPRFCISASSQVMPVLPIGRSVGSTLNSTDKRKQLLSCESDSNQMISEAILPAPWRLPGWQALCDAHSENIHCREDMLILFPQWEESCWNISLLPEREWYF